MINAILPIVLTLSLVMFIITEMIRVTTKRNNDRKFLKVIAKNKKQSKSD